MEESEIITGLREKLTKWAFRVSAVKMAMAQGALFGLAWHGYGNWYPTKCCKLLSEAHP
jgi:hypothetical protein